MTGGAGSKIIAAVAAMQRNGAMISLTLFRLNYRTTWLSVAITLINTEIVDSIIRPRVNISILNRFCFITLSLPRLRKVISHRQCEHTDDVISGILTAPRHFIHAVHRHTIQCQIFYIEAIVLIL